MQKELKYHEFLEKKKLENDMYLKFYISSICLLKDCFDHICMQIFISTAKMIGANNERALNESI
jgi:hypothetical protein